MSFSTSFQKTAVSREWVNKHINSGHEARIKKVDAATKGLKAKEKAAILNPIERSEDRMRARARTLNDPKTSNKAFRDTARHQIKDMKAAYKPTSKVSVKSNKLKLLAGGALALGAAGAVTAGYLKRKHKNESKAS